MNKEDGIEELAIIRRPGFGMRDAHHPILWFDVEMLGYGALIVMGVDEAARVMKEGDIYDITKLDGKPCVVRRDDGLVRFVRFWGK